MQVYDLDKTQEWLNRTLMIRREPPVRGGVRTDFRARRQTAAGLGIVAVVLAVLALLPVRHAALARAAATDSAPQAAAAAPPAILLAPEARNMTTRSQAPMALRDGGPFLDTMPQAFGFITSRGPAIRPVAPPAPIWLDGR